MLLYKYLPSCGACSRRQSSELIKSYNVKVNGQIISDLFYEVKDDDVVQVKGKVLELPSFKYILLNKPKDYLCTLSDERGRKTIFDLIDNKRLGRIYPVGRLDRMTTGLVLLTNDGDLTQKLSHPKYEIPKGYKVQLDRAFRKSDFEELLKGIHLEDGFIKVDDLSYVTGQKNSSVQVEIHSGRNHIVRRMFDFLGYTVRKLDRFYYAGLTKKNLPLGKWRKLTKGEVDNLKKVGDKVNSKKHT